MDDMEGGILGDFVGGVLGKELGLLLAITVGARLGFDVRYFSGFCLFSSPGVRSCLLLPILLCLKTLSLARCRCLPLEDVFFLLLVAEELARNENRKQIWTTRLPLDKPCF